MKVTALLFASFRATAGRPSLDLELEGDATVRRVADAVEASVAGLSLDGALCAVNEDYADPERRLADGDRVAFLPPVSGG